MSATQEERDAAARAFMDDPDVEAASYDEYLYGEGRNIAYTILTDEEADEIAREHIRRDVWAFRPSFLVHYLPEGVTEDVVEALQSTKYEDAAPALLAMLGDRFEEFADDAISSDGRGHFISGYDGEEDEFEHDGRTWYAYRQ